jgi:hypothetical protein
MSSWLLQLAYAAAVASGQVPATCRSCHQRIVDSFTRTAHARTTTQAGAATIKADFSAGHNILRTRAPGVWFRMERRADGFYETGFDSATGASRTERIDLVVGSGKRGQTYLYWRNGLLYELPVSYLTGARQWINSPGYIDGQIDFGRVIVPRCLECHSTMFAPARDARVLRYSSDYRLGVSCEKCHGDGRQHVKNRTAGAAAGPPDIYNPARASRDRQVDVCALCHSGRREQRRAPFAFRPGDRLDAFLFPEADDAAPDVHGNQVGLLRRSKCYRSSPAMSCATCHDVHQTQRDVAAFTPKCQGCHDVTRHPNAAAIGWRLTRYCVDCHMPTRQSDALQINTAARSSSLFFRSHLIGIYPDVAAHVMRVGKANAN